MFVSDRRLHRHLNLHLCMRVGFGMIGEARIGAQDKCVEVTTQVLIGLRLINRGLSS